MLTCSEEEEVGGGEKETERVRDAVQRLSKSFPIVVQDYALSDASGISDVLL